MVHTTIILGDISNSASNHAIFLQFVDCKNREIDRFDNDPGMGDRDGLTLQAIFPF